ncbi:hypothetical protein [Amycolatopsis sp. cg9]|uniref:hypothetical protein n=1 Tax=Amycolatopsis sp. cg9 TaxID=3238801 RepID=UPI003523D8DF
MGTACRFQDPLSGVPGAEDLIAAAVGPGPMGLVSPSPRRSVEAVVTAFGFAHHQAADARPAAKPCSP